MSWLDHLKLSFRKFCAEIIKLDKSEHTPILFEDYNNEDYYYKFSKKQYFENKTFLYNLRQELQKDFPDAWINTFPGREENTFCITRPFASLAVFAIIKTRASFAFGSSPVVSMSKERTNNSDSSRP